MFAEWNVVNHMFFHIFWGGCGISKVPKAPTPASTPSATSSVRPKSATELATPKALPQSSKKQPAKKWGLGVLGAKSLYRSSLLYKKLLFAA